MRTLQRFLFVGLFAAIAAALPAQAESRRNDDASSFSHRLRPEFLATDDGTAIVNDQRFGLDRQTSATFHAEPAGGPGGRRFRIQVRNLLTDNDRLELGRLPDLQLTKRLLASLEPMWSRARHAQRSGLTTRAQFAYHAGEWGVALGTSPDLRDRRLQVRLTYSLRY